jgi:hypothetical protein
MIREEYLRRLIDGCHVDLYLSATDGARIYWPYRMQPVHEASERFRNACEQYIVDSSFKDESIGNREVLETAHALDAEVAVLADVYQDCAATIEAVLEGLDLVDEHAYDGEVMVPLQPPHGECYAALAGQGIDRWAIGGVKDADAETKVAAARAVRERAGFDVSLHGLGFGVTDTLVAAVRETPALLDSLDYSTPVQNAMAVPAEPGAERMSVVAARAAAQLVVDARRLSDYVREPTADDLREEGQQGLEVVGE